MSVHRPLRGAVTTERTKKWASNRDDETIVAAALLRP